MKSFVKWFVGLGIVALLVVVFLFFKPVSQQVVSRSSSFYWYSGRQSSNEVRLPDVVSFSDRMSFFDYSVSSEFSPGAVCSIDSRGFIQRGCCAKFRVYKNGVLIDTIPSDPVGFISSSVSKSYGIFSITFLTGSHFEGGSNTCFHVDSAVDFSSTPVIDIVSSVPSNVSFGVPLNFRVDIVNNWSYPVKGVLSVKYSASNFLGSLDKVVNYSVDVPVGRSFRDVSIDLMNYSGSLYVTPSLILFVDQSNFAGLNSKCVQRSDSTVWDGLVDAAKFCVGVPIGSYSGDSFKVDVLPESGVAPVSNVGVSKGIPMVFWYVVFGIVLFIVLIIVLRSKKGKK